MPLFRTEYYISYLCNQLLQEKLLFSVRRGTTSFFILFPLNFSVFYDVKHIVEYSHIGSISRFIFSKVFFVPSKMKKARGVKEIVKIVRQTSMGIRVKRRRIIPLLSPFSINGFSFSIFGESGFFSFFSFCLYSIPGFILRYDHDSFWKMEYVSFFLFCKKEVDVKQSMVLQMNLFWFLHFTNSFFDFCYYYFKGFFYGINLCFGSPFNRKNTLFFSRVLLSLMGFSIF